MNTKGLLTYLALLALLSLSVMVKASESSSSDATSDQLSAMADNFVNLSSVYNNIQSERQQQQFLYYLDTIRKDLYQLEERTRRFYYGIPNTVPDRNEKKSLKRKLNKLDDALEDVIEKMQLMKANIEGIADYADDSIEQAAGHRSNAINEAQRSLENLKTNKQWDSAKIKSSFSKSIRTLNKVQHKITEFQMGVE